MFQLATLLNIASEIVFPLTSADICVYMYIYIYICIYIYIYVYIYKKTNKLQVHPYRPVSWLPTHHGI